MSNFVAFVEELEEVFTPEGLDGDIDIVGSYNHSYLQINLGALLKMAGDYTVCGELTWDVSSLDLSKFQIKAKEGIKPDLCIYPKRGLSRPVDILRMTEMPVTAIEILSPLQGTYEILHKFGVYFALGVQTCWLVDPATEIVAVYTAFDQHTSFSSGDVVDEVLGLRLAVKSIFE